MWPWSKKKQAKPAVPAPVPAPARSAAAPTASAEAAQPSANSLDKDGKAREQWIEFHLQNGNYDEARALGWEGEVSSTSFVASFASPTDVLVEAPTSPKSPKSPNPMLEMVEERKTAAVKVQALGRGGIARRSTSSLRDEQSKKPASLESPKSPNAVTVMDGDSAAAAVQAAARGRQVRQEKQLADQFEDEMKALKEQRQAATAVQASMRGREVRKEVEQKKEAAAAVQASVRGRAVRKEKQMADQFEEEMKALKEQRQAATAVQASMRGRTARKEVEQLKVTDDELRAMMVKFDRNHSGKLDHKELRKALETLGLKMDSTHVQALLLKHDKDKTGLLEFDEFKALYLDLKKISTEEAGGDESKGENAGGAAEGEGQGDGKEGMFGGDGGEFDGDGGGGGDEMEEAAAAAAVQAAARGRQVRQEKQLADQFEDEMKALKEQRQAATAVQASMRGREVRKEVEQKKEAAAAVQASVRGRAVRKEKQMADQFEEEMKALKEQRQAATAVQASMRGRTARKEVEQLKEEGANFQERLGRSLRELDESMLPIEARSPKRREEDATPASAPKAEESESEQDQLKKYWYWLQANGSGTTGDPTAEELGRLQAENLRLKAQNESMKIKMRTLTKRQESFNLPSVPEAELEANGDEPESTAESETSVFQSTEQWASAAKEASNKTAQSAAKHQWGRLEVSVAEDPSLQGTLLPLWKPVHQVGREKLRTDRKRVSKVHFHISKDSTTGGVNILDLSAWGTYVDGERLPFKKPTPLAPGAVITIATDRLEDAMFALRFLKPLAPLASGKLDLLQSMGLPAAEPVPVEKAKPPTTQPKQVVQVKYGIAQTNAKRKSKLPPGMPPVS